MKNTDFADKFDIVLDASDPNFADKFRDALGLQPGEILEIITPQFTRTDGKIISYFPRSVEEFDGLKLLPEETLRKLGLGVWSRDDNNIHWLYPGEWYSSIPNGYNIVYIDGETGRFESNKTDDDIRFGCLAYGFLQPIGVK